MCAAGREAKVNPSRDQLKAELEVYRQGKREMAKIIKDMSEARDQQ